MLRNILLLPLLAPLVLAQTGVVEGSVVNSITRAGIEGVVVTLAGSDAIYKATTDASGAFHIADIQEGDYTPIFAKREFMSPPADHPARKAIHVASGGNAVRLQVELAAWPVLRGRVLDADGRPAAKVDVALMRFHGSGASLTTTDGDGRFVIGGVGPGSYGLLARNAATTAKPSKGADGQLMMSPPTYYPGVIERSQAAQIVLRPGSELDGYEIRLRAVPGFRVHGVVLDDRGRPASGIPVKLAPADIRDQMMEGALRRLMMRGETPEAQVISGAQGDFEFPAVWPGEWQFIAETSHNQTMLKGFGSGLVSTHDVENIQIRLRAPFPVKGFVERDDPRDAKGIRQVTSVALMPADGATPAQYAIAKHAQDGTMEWDQVHPGRYRIAPMGTVPGFYVDAVRLGNRDVLGQAVDLDGSLPIRVIYKPNGGRVLGTVEECAGATVVVLPLDESLLSNQFIRTAGCDASGKFEIANLRPGDYSAAAFDRILESGAFEDPVFVRNLAPRLTKVQVAQGQSTSIQLRVTSWPE